VAGTPGPTLRATPEVAGTNLTPDATVTPEISPIKELQAHLDKLQARYLEPSPREQDPISSKVLTVAEKPNIKLTRGPRLPSHEELNQLGSSIEKVASQLRIKKISLPHLHGVIKHIDRHYPKTGLEDFVAKLVKRITALPVPISTRIKQALADCKAGDTTRKAGLRTVQELLKARDLEPQATDRQWRDLYPLLMEFTSDRFKQLVKLSKPSTMGDIDYEPCKAAFQGVLGFAAFHDVQRQHLIWILDYEPKVVPVARWVYAFQNEQWDRELRKVLHGSAATPEQIKEQMEPILETERKRRWRKTKQSTLKSVDKKPIQPPKPYKKRGHCT
jgi:hypothetical protein